MGFPLLFTAHGGSEAKLFEISSGAALLAALLPLSLAWWDKRVARA